MERANRGKGDHAAELNTRTSTVSYLAEFKHLSGIGGEHGDIASVVSLQYQVFT